MRPDPRPERIFLSPPHLTGEELTYLREAVASGWIAPLGPQVDAFEAALAGEAGTAHAVALSSGTAALHLALQLVGVGPGDEVLVSALTFVASVNPIRYLGATPAFVDSERVSWNLDPDLLRDELARRARSGRLPAAVVVVHLYGQCADLDPILAACAEHGVPVVEDAAEALGSTYRGRPPGGRGRAGVFSFNGNKILTTSGGGALVTDDPDLAAHARKLATQARDPAPHYEHSEVGYNYRMSNLLAAVGRAQLRALEDRVRARRAVYTRYVDGLGDLPGLSFQPEAPWGSHTRWLTCVLLDEEFGADPGTLRLALEDRNIEARPLWKPMHLQPLYRACEVIGGGEVAADLYRRGLCLPSGSSLGPAEQDRVVEAIRGVAVSATAAR